MYANNLGDLNSSRNPPFTNEYNTDWQLVTPKQIYSIGDYSWDNESAAVELQLTVQPDYCILNF